MKIAVVGIGYVGLSVAVMLSVKYEVTILDVVEEKVRLVNKRQSPLKDEYIEEYFASQRLRLKASRDTAKAYAGSDMVIIAVPTNYDGEKEFFDTSAVEAVVKEVARVNTKAIIVVKSTVPVGFTEGMQREYQENLIMFSPEFLRESKALYDTLYPSRVIVGVTSTRPEAREAAEKFANMLCEGSRKEKVEKLIMRAGEAEAAKLFSNTYLAMRIAYMNELDTYAEEKGMNSKAILRAIGLDWRIGEHYNNPSFGYGGYCLPKDSKQLCSTYGEIPQKLVTAVIESNRARKDYVASRIKKQVDLLKKEGVNKPLVGIYRLNMKSNSDNFRNSSILGVIRRLKEEGIALLLYEPMLAAADVFEEIPVVRSFEEFSQSSHLIVANRVDDQLEEVRNKVYTRDVFGRD